MKNIIFYTNSSCGIFWTISDYAINTQHITCNTTISWPHLACYLSIILHLQYGTIISYRDRFSGQLQRSATAQNVHFHLLKDCILIKYPGFSVKFLKIGPEFIPYLQQEHLQHLTVNFGWTFNG